ncbi:MAG: glycosyltransferase [Actinomycetota bacterium]
MSLSVLVVTSGWPSDEHPDQSVFVAHEVEALRAAGVVVDVIHYRGRADPSNYLKARRKVRRRLRDRDVDLVHAHFGQTLLVVLPSSVPVVATFHGSDLIGVVSASGRYGIRGGLLRRLTRMLARWVDAVVVPSRALQAKLPEHVRSTVIPGAVDTEVFRPADKAEARRTLGLPADRKLVLFGGRRSVPVKRFELARAAVDLLPGEGADLVDVDGVPRGAMALYMSACDAMVVTSRHESGPLVVKEALACNLPVVSVDVGDVSEWIGSLPGCAICLDDKPETIARALRDVLASDIPFTGAEVIAPLDPSMLVRSTIDVYRTVLAARRD